MHDEPLFDQLAERDDYREPALYRGRELTVVGLDAVSGTPVLDLKPVTAGFQGRGRPAAGVGQRDDGGLFRRL